MLKSFIILFFIFVSFAFQMSGYVQGNEALFVKTSDNQWHVVDKILRADRLLLKSGERIQLIGLEAPEVSREFLRRISGKTTGPELTVISDITLEEKSFLFSRTLFEGKKVRLELDVQKRNENWDTLAYVFLEDGTFANTEVLRQGFANLQIRPPNMKYVKELREAYREAKKELKGFQGE